MVQQHFFNIMKTNKIWLFVFFIGIFICAGCGYRKGDIFYYRQTNDSLRFIVRNAGNGKKILNKLNKLRVIHQKRLDECRVIFLSDSTEVIKNKAVLLFNSEMPDFEEDMLTKGYLGAFGTKEIVTYMIVNKTELEQFFVEDNTQN